MLSVLLDVMHVDCLLPSPSHCLETNVFVLRMNRYVLSIKAALIYNPKFRKRMCLVFRQGETFFTPNSLQHTEGKAPVVIHAETKKKL